ncbi:MAG: HPr family phosphocarrier protein [Saccharofermentanales bacterium]
MVSKSLIFNFENVLPTKAVAMLIQTASAFRSSVWISRGERRANAKSLLGVMSLGIENKTELVITAEGSDEKEALDAVTDFLSHPAL